MYYVGLDIGGTGIQVAVVDAQGRILAKNSIPTRTDLPFDEQIAQMAQCTRETVADSGVSLDDIHSIGAGVPGIADQCTGIVPFCTNLGWKEVPFRTEFQKHFDKPVYIDNDATVAGLAEAIAGGSAGTHSSVFLTLGTGVGGGIILNGKVWSGCHGVSGEIGHMILMIDGEPCTCGNRGCLERYCSATAIIRMAREEVVKHPESLILTLCGGDPEKINAKNVFDAARENDPVGTEVYHRYISYLSQGIANIMNFLDPEVIVLGGGVSKAGAFLLDALREEVPKHLIFKTMPHARIELAQLGADAGVIGAALLGKVN